MPILLRLLARRVRRPGSWALPVAVAAFVFATSYVVVGGIATLTTVFARIADERIGSEQLGRLVTATRS